MASRFGMDAHTCEAASQAWAGFCLAELDPLPRDCKYPTDYAGIRLLSAGEETDMLSVSLPSETDPQLCELSLSSNEEPEATNSNDEPVDVRAAEVLECGFPWTAELVRACSEDDLYETEEFRPASSKLAVTAKVGKVVCKPVTKALQS